MHNNAPGSPTSASTRGASCSPVPTEPAIASAHQQIEDYADPIFQESEPFQEVTAQVRKENRDAFELKRQELRKDWSGFDKAYDDYRRWRDSPEDKRNEFEVAGKAAQLAIMKRSGVAGTGMMEMFKLLAESTPPSELLRFISPINGDFRAPKEGVIAGLRYASEGGKWVPTLAFPGTGAGSMIRAQIRTNINQFMGKGGVPAAHQLGVSLARECNEALKKQIPKKEPLAFSGHSLGGGIATYASAVVADPTLGYKPRCYTFNPAALGRATLGELLKYPDLKERVENHKIIRVKNDHVSSPAMQRRLAAFLTVQTQRRIVVPRHLGTVYVIPREYLDEQNRSVADLHRLESLTSVYSMARHHRGTFDSTVHSPKS